MELKPYDRLCDKKAAKNLDEMWKRIVDYSRHDTLTASIMAYGYNNQLSTEETAIMLAYEALKKSERLLEALLNYHRVQANPPIVCVDGKLIKGE
jgi:uncharacterized protein HemY